MNYKHNEPNKTNWRIVTYGSVYDVYDLLAKSHNTKAFAAIVHDCDVDEDGVIKPPHIHVLLQLYDRRYASTVRNLLYRLDDTSRPVSVLVQPSSELKNDYAYLTHANSPDKYQYSKDALFEFGRFSFDDKNKYSRMIDDIVQDNLSPFGLVERYGLDFVRNIKSISFICRWQMNFHEVGRISQKNLESLKKTERDHY